MSHSLVRKDDRCLNCGSFVLERFCSHCGQENIEPKESVGHFILHFFNDITHFDGKFFTTIQDLIFKPGFLSKEYMEGRRVRYLNPVRMYLFSSFIFFLIFFSFYHFDNIDFSNRKFNQKTRSEIRKLNDVQLDSFTRNLNSGKPLTRQELEKYIDSITSTVNIKFGGNSYKNRKEYDSLINAGKEHPGWLRKKIAYRQFEISDKFKDDQQGFLKRVFETFQHRFPQILFVSLPFVALFLKLIYIRRKKFYYVSHAIFTIHLYIFTFIILLLSMGISGLNSLMPWNGFNYFYYAITLVLLFYLYKALRNFYQQGIFKTLMKYLLLLVFFILLSGVLVTIFFSFSFLEA